MDEQRKNIIVNEIKYWKQNRMLPEHYCNFLLNLYTEGTSNKKDEGDKRFLIKRVIPLLLVALLLLSIFLFYFTELSFILQITLGIFLIISSFFSLLYLLLTSFELLQIIISFLLLLIGTVQAAESFFPDNSYIIYFVTVGNSLVWLLSGFKWRIISLKLSGICGLIIIGITILI